MLEVEEYLLQHDRVSERSIALLEAVIVRLRNSLFG